MIKSLLSFAQSLLKRPIKKDTQKDTILKHYHSDSKEGQPTTNNINPINVIPPITPPTQRLELEVFNYLKSLQVNDMNIFCNLYVPYKSYEDTSYMEIDIIATTKNGIFVFECKDYNAHISGDVSLQNWTAKYNKEEVYALANPIYQNKQHADVLKNYLNISSTHILPIVVMNFKTLKVDLGNNIFFVDDEYLEHRLKLALKLNLCELSSKELNKINSLLLNATNVDADIKEQHKLRIKSKFNN